MDNEEYYTVNTTFKIAKKDFINVENELRAVFEVLDYKKIVDTEHLTEDTHFKKLVKAKKNAQIELYRYVNKNMK